MNLETKKEHNYPATLRLAIRISKQFVWPLCRSIARHTMRGNKPAGKVIAFLASMQFWLFHQYWPHINRPRSFSEKIFFRMLFERAPLWVTLSDKLLVREYVASKGAANFLIPLLWIGDNPEEIPFSELPPKYVIKANHGCGYNIIITDKKKIDQASIKDQLQAWLSENFCQDKYLGIGWAYKNIRPKIMIEQFLDDYGQAPIDYKFFCYSGRAEFLQVSFNRHGEPTELILNRDLVALDVYNGVRINPGPLAPPDNYCQMLQLAELLAQQIDFIRVDLYSLGGHIYFGECTCYPAGGLARFIPQKYDFIFGKNWNINIVK